MFIRRIISSLLCALMISQALSARTASVRAADDPETRTAVRAPEAKALALLDRVVEDARTLRLPEDRVFIQTTAAGLLWGHDARRARLVYAEALAGLLELAQGRGEGGARDEGAASLSAELREKLVDEVAQRDAVLAREFLEGTRGLAPPEAEARLQLRIAARTAASDPRQALRVARASMSKGVSAELTGLLSGLRQSDAEAAACLARELLEKLRAENLADNFEAATVALELLRMSAAPTAGAPLLDSGGMGELASLIASAALRPAGGNEELLLTLPTVMPEIEKYVPSLAPRLRRRVAQANRTFDKDGDGSEAHTAEHDEAGGVVAARPGTRAERAAAMIKRAAESERKGERREALELLGEARALLSEPARDSGELGSQLLLAQGYVVLNPQASLEILGRLVEQLNALADAAVAVDGFLTDERLSREGELLLQPLSDSFGMMLEDEGAGLCSLARVEFDQTVEIVDRLQRPEARILARLFVARAALSPPAQPRRQTARLRVPARGRYPG